MTTRKLGGALAITAKYPKFFECTTGGGCMALSHRTKDDGYILVTDLDGCRIPEPTDTTVIVGRYDKEGSPVGDESIPELSVGSLETWIDVQLGRYAPDARVHQRYAFIKEGVLFVDGGRIANEERAAGELVLVSQLSRAELMDVCTWNDPNGIFKDADMMSEYDRVATDLELRECVWSWCRDEGFDYILSLLNDECARLKLDAMDIEQIECLRDPTRREECEGMLDDLAARCGLNVDAARKLWRTLS